MRDSNQKPERKALFFLTILFMLSISDLYAQSGDSLSKTGAIARWFESQLGLPPWFIILIVAPIFVSLLVFLLRLIVLTVAFYFEKRPRSRKIWRRISLYLTVFLAILVLFFIWESRVAWIAEDLSSDSGNSMSELLPYFIGLLHAFMATMILVFAIFLLQRGFRAALSSLKILAAKTEGGRFQKIMSLTSNRMHRIIVLGLRIIRFVILLVLFYYYIPLMLSFFPATASFAKEVMPYVTRPTVKVLNAIVGYIPKLVTLILIIVIVRYLLKFSKNFFAAIGNEEIKIRGFDPEWSEQTNRLIRIVIILAGIMISYPFLPGSGSEIFKGFSLFIGAVITLGSTSAVNNIVSGIVLTYTRAFRLGDRVKIGNTLGDIVEKKLFVTRLKTFKNELVTLPNGQVLGNSIVNLSAAAKTEGLFVNALVGISYNVDWRKVHELMKRAAQQTHGIISKPGPFVLETDLGDFAVTYKVMAMTNDPKRVLHIEAELRRNLLDIFNAEGVEIMSPSFTSIRESTTPMIPPEYNPKPFSFMERKNRT